RNATRAWHPVWLPVEAGGGRFGRSAPRRGASPPVPDHDQRTRRASPSALGVGAHSRDRPRSHRRSNDMSRRLFAQVTALYPRAWRERYTEELSDLHERDDLPAHVVPPLLARARASGPRHSQVGLFDDRSELLRPRPPIIEIDYRPTRHSMFPG